MNDINKMPPVCAHCPYWEVCKPPYICPDIEDKKPKRTDERTETHACDLIDRAEAIDALRTHERKPSKKWFDNQLDIEWNNAIDICCYDIEDLPSAQPGRKKGKWIYGEDEYGIDGYHCDKCGFFVPWDYAHKFINYIEDYNFCPNCGAWMKGGNS